MFAAYAAHFAQDDRMKLLIAAIGKAKASPEQQLYSDYIRRLKWKSELKEFDVKLDDALKRKMREGELLLGACKGYDKIIALDEHGKDLGSQAFANHLKRWQGQGHSSFAFLIGGADGLDKTVVEKSHLVWSLGKVTWPHMLVRALLTEQLYRAYSILGGHPYHRG